MNKNLGLKNFFSSLTIVIIGMVFCLAGCKSSNNSSDNLLPTQINEGVGNFYGKVAFHIFNKMYNNGPFGTIDISCIYQINADGSEEIEKIGEANLFRTLISFSPSGKYFAFITNDHLKIIDRGGVSIFESSHSGDYCWDGDERLFLAKGESIFIINLENLTETQIYEDKKNAYFFNTSPVIVNQTLFFSHFEDQGTDGETYISSCPNSAHDISFEDCDIHQLDFFKYDYACLASVGDSLLFTPKKNILCALDLEEGYGGSNSVSSIPTHPFRGFKVSPDEKYLAYCSPEEFLGRQIFIMAKNGEIWENARVLTLDEKQTIQGFCWSPTSHEIAILSKEEKGSLQVIYRISIYELSSDTLWIVKEVCSNFNFGQTGETETSYFLSAFKSIVWAP